MKTTIDVAGRLVNPKENRQRAGLQPGMSLDVHWNDGQIEIEPVPMTVKLVPKGRFVVAVSATEGEALTAETVEATRQEIARGRDADL